ncbi:MAG TPA: RNA polymerase sigma factor RpoD, partial [Alphaproteobacteria bacterium]|nr:RNA polymerase sigma factor RpoD [Alphaproteobacteria bacterium]
LSREGEIAIAKRIEAGRETMIAGLCESPVTFQAIIVWREELNEERVLLRDIIDLDATLGKGPGQPGNEANATNEAVSTTANQAVKAEAPAKEEKAAEGDTTEADASDDDDDEDADADNNMSLAAMEALLRPQVLEIFDKIAANYKKLHKLEEARIEGKVSNDPLSTQQEKRYVKLRDETVTLVQSLHLNNNRIEALVDLMYSINKRLIGFEGRLLRLADYHGVDRAEFLDQYRGHELDANWTRRVARLKSKGWQDFTKKERAQIKEIRDEIAQISQETGLEIAEFRRIVHTVQKGEKEARQAKKEMVEA